LPNMEPFTKREKDLSNPNEEGDQNAGKKTKGDRSELFKLQRTLRGSGSGSRKKARTQSFRNKRMSAAGKKEAKREKEVRGLGESQPSKSER